MPISRRNFIDGVGRAGGVSAAYTIMQAMGLLPSPVETAAAMPQLQPGSGKGVKVVILGAGMAGLASAIELNRAGYEVTLLEPHDRVGGHNWSVRRGTKVEFTDGSVQNCQFGEGMYFNCGPARLPSHHQNVLGYCREFGVDLEVEVNVSRSSFLRNGAYRNGEAVALRRVVNDTRGHVSELLAKAVNQGALDKDLTPRDKERMVSFLQQYGDLSPDLFYKGSARSGYKVPPGAADQVGVPNDPLDMSALLDLDMMSDTVFEDNIVMQATMFQPVGGMDMIPRALGKKLGPAVKLMTEVTEIRRADSGVRIIYRDRKTSTSHEIKADYCVCTIPLPVLAKIPADFAPEIRSGIGKVSGGNAMKLAFESRRFWEQDYQIYGGISFTRGPVAPTPIWHPSGRFHSEKGILVYYGGAADFGDQPLERQYEGARAAIDGVYPGHGKELYAPVSVQWGKVPYHLGTGARFTEDTRYLYDRLNQADGPFYFANDYLSHVSGWQEGAIYSAFRAVASIDLHRKHVRVQSLKG